jgi:hypothetical protein
MGDVLFAAVYARRLPMFKYDLTRQTHPPVLAAARPDARVDSEASTAPQGLRARQLHELPGIVVVEIEGYTPSERQSARKLEKIVDTVSPGQLFRYEIAFPSAKLRELRRLIIQALQMRYRSRIVGQGHTIHHVEGSPPDLS